MINSPPLPASRSTIHAIGLLMVAGVLAVARPAFAQTEEACPLPVGVTPPPPPRVTAQQVEAGSASVMDFVLAVRDQNAEISRSATSAEQLLYLGCLVRQEGSPYRSGSTYLVQLTPDGRVFVHAKDMSLAARQLSPLIYAEILFALGVPPTVLIDLASPEPGTRDRAFAALFHALSQEPDGPFDATRPIPGVRPGIPGASGHAAAYVSASFGLPLLLIGGFDLNESHLAQEEIDYGDPSIAASDVVDRNTLKAFVTEAGNYVLGLQESGDVAASSKARIALRDPNGPWRHGSVYLYVLDRVSNIILFHGAFPNRFELRPLQATVRDVVTGELVLPQILAAATSSPEGGFVQYYFDDPTDDTDRADIPKVGYAREFSGSFETPDGNVIRTNLIVGSGFYLGAPNVVAARQNTAIETVMPQVMRAMTANTIDAISGRIQRATLGTGAPSTMELSVGGASTLSNVLIANGQALESGSFDLGRLLAGSSFSLPLGAAGARQRGPLGTLTLWGSGSYRDFAGGNPETLGYDGNVLSANFGIDTWLGEGLLAGLSVARAKGAVDYTAFEAVTGELTTPLTSIHPYLGWQAPGGVNLWATAGHGWGEVELNDASGDTQARGLTQRMAAAGVSMALAASEGMIEGGTTSLRLKGETAFTQADVDGAGNLRETMLNVSRHRLMFEAAHARRLGSEATLTPSIEIGVRYDGGDGETGAGADVAAGLIASNVVAGLSVDARVRTLLVHEAEGYEERGMSVSLIYDPTPSTPLGFTARVSPSWGGDAINGAQGLWSRQTMAGLGAGIRESDNRLNAELGYALPVGSGLVGTPRLGVTASEYGRDLRLGYTLAVLQGGAVNFHLGLDAQRRETLLHRQPDHSLHGRISLTW